MEWRTQKETYMFVCAVTKKKKVVATVEQARIKACFSLRKWNTDSDDEQCFFFLLLSLDIYFLLDVSHFPHTTAGEKKICGGRQLLEIRTVFSNPHLINQAECIRQLLYLSCSKKISTQRMVLREKVFFLRIFFFFIFWWKKVKKIKYGKVKWEGVPFSQ